jgi:hypothetical protein
LFFILHNHARTKTPFVPQSTHRRADDAIRRRIDVRGGITGDRDRERRKNPEAFTRCRSGVETSLRIIIICVRVRWKLEDDPALARE